ncbi:MAG: hypothetical protein GX310_02525 [Synergistaceae bacterium]|nr:hypothetical protein [Synergistaceae bacterium]
MAKSSQKKTKKGSAAFAPARQITVVIFTVIICVTIVLAVISLDLMLNPSKNWTDSLAVRWIADRRNMLPFFR